MCIHDNSYRRSARWFEAKHLRKQKRCPWFLFTAYLKFHSAIDISRKVLELGGKFFKPAC